MEELRRALLLLDGRAAAVDEELRARLREPVPVEDELAQGFAIIDKGLEICDRVVTG